MKTIKKERNSIKAKSRLILDNSHKFEPPQPREKERNHGFSVPHHERNRRQQRRAYRIYLVTEHCETFDTNIRKMKRKWKCPSVQFTKWT